MESPISACTSITLSGGTPNFSITSRDADALVLHGVVHDHAVVHELHQVLVGRHDGGGGAGLAGMPRIGRDQVVGLEAGLLQAGDVEGAHRLADQRELRDEVVGRRPAGAPCIPGRSRCGRSSPTCRRSRRDASACSSGFMSLSSFHSMLQKPSTALTCNAVGLAGQRRQRVIGAEDVARAVDQEDVVALLERPAAPAGFLGGRCAAAGFRGFGFGFGGGWHGPNVGRRPA